MEVSDNIVFVDHCTPEPVTMVNLGVPEMEDTWSENNIGDQNINACINNSDIPEDSLIILHVHGL